MPDHSITVLPVHSRGERREFVELPFRLYRDEPHWVPPLYSQQRAFLDPRRNPFFEHAEVALWLARRDGRTAGRVSTHVDHLYNATHGESLAMFGFFDAEDGAVAEALIATALAWAKERGATALRGPLSFSINHECGVIAEGFDEPAVVLMPYTPPRYLEYLERGGFVKAMDLLCFRLRRADVEGDPGKLPPKLLRAAERVGERNRRTGLIVRPLDPRRYHDELRRGVEVFNRAWASNWGSVPVTGAEQRYFAAELRPIVDPALCFVAEAGGETVGIVMCVADANQVLAHLGGRLLPFGWVKALRLRRSVRAARFLLFGVLEEHRGRGVDALLVLELLKAALAAGYETLELTWILETNEPVLRLISDLAGPLGSRPHRRYRIYEMAL